MADLSGSRRRAEPRSSESTTSRGITASLFVWIYEHPAVFPLVNDCASWIAGMVIAMAWTRQLVGASAGVAIAATIGGAAIQAFMGKAVGNYRGRWRVSSFDDVVAITLVWAFGAAVLLAGSGLLALQGRTDLPETAIVGGAVVAIAVMLGQRVVWRRWWERRRRPPVEGNKRTVVFGAGEVGAQVVRAMLADPHSTYYPVALIDDNPTLANRSIVGVRVEGTRHDLASVAAKHKADVLLVAIAYADSTLIQEAVRLAKEVDLEYRVLPSTSELVGKTTVADVRPPTVEDLLGRDPVDIDLNSVKDYITGRSVLITGAGGSIGSELARQIHRLGPDKLYLLDRDESALHELQLSIQDRALLDSEELIVADIRDRERVQSIFHDCRPQVVFHTAALKHLTLLENHPGEGIKTNTLGTRNLLDAALAVDVERFVNISTDKAADPSCVLGATKLAAERLTAAAAKESGLPYLSVRFGNVLGSRGSVLPIFLHQIERGKAVTVTHKDVTRYFMTIPEAVRLVVQAGAIGDPGEVLILDMGEPVRIVDLAQQLIDLIRPGTPIEFTGLRPGEKLHEVLIARDEVGAAKIHPRITHTASDDSAEPADALEIMGPEVVDQARIHLSDPSRLGTTLS